MDPTIVLLLAFCTIFSHVSSEYCYYIEATKGKDSYLHCESLGDKEVIEGISLLHLTYDTTIPELQKSLFAPFKDLKTLYITAANVESIEPGAFDRFPLEMVDLCYNQLRTIENGTFDSLITLRFLDLSHNKFETLEAQTFTGLTSLEWLALNSNKLRTISKGTFNHMRNLRALYLHFNSFLQLEAETFQNLVYLELLDLSFNNLRRIQFGLFADLQNVQTLLLNNNHLENISDHVFDNATSLTLLDISQNKLKKLQENLFRRTNNLKILKLASNRISEFNSTLLLRYTPNLEEIHLFHNQWMCKHLHGMMEDFAKKPVFVATETPILNSTIGNIGCINIYGTQNTKPFPLNF